MSEDRDLTRLKGFSLKGTVADLEGEVVGVELEEKEGAVLFWSLGNVEKLGEAEVEA